MKSEKKVVLLMLYSGSPEADAILPVVFKLSRRFKTFTYFKSQKTFDSLKSNNGLFQLWRKISNGYYIESKLDNFWWKILRHVFVVVVGFEI